MLTSVYNRVPPVVRCDRSKITATFQLRILPSLWNSIRLDLKTRNNDEISIAPRSEMFPSRL